MTDTKTCANPPCGRTFTRDGRRPSHWAHIRYCSITCGHAGRRIATEPKTCPACGREFTRGRGTTAGHWAKRRYCSRPCATAGLNGTAPPDPTEVPDPDPSWRDRALCRDTDPELFAEIDRVTPEQLRDIADTAHTWCARCPVRVDCGAYADRHQHTGLWGGTYRRGTIGRIRRVDMLEVARRWTA